MAIGFIRVGRKLSRENGGGSETAQLMPFFLADDDDVIYLAHEKGNFKGCPFIKVMGIVLMQGNSLFWYDLWLLLKKKSFLHQVCFLYQEATVWHA